MKEHSSIRKCDGIEENIRNGYYERPFNPYEPEPNIPKHQVETLEDAYKLVELMKKYDSKIKDYRRRILKHYNDLYELKEEFHEDLKKEFNMVNDRREEKIFKMAMEYAYHGERYNFFCAYKYYSDICKLIRNE